MQNDSRRLKIAQVTSSLDRGGSSDIVRITCERLTGLGHDVILISGPTERPARKTAEFLKNFSGHFIEIPKHDIAALAELYKIFTREKFDVIHTHTGKAGFLAGIAGRLAGCRAVVHTSHGRVFYGHSRLPFFSDKVIAFTEIEKREMIRQRVCPAEKIVVICPGIEPEPYALHETDRESLKAGFGFSDNDKVVGMVGRLETVKGPEYFVEAASFIAARWPEARFIVAGDGSLRKGLEARVVDLGLEKKFVFAGWREDIPGVLSVIDILVMPSLNEAVGMAAVEAARAGSPLIATNVGGVPEMVKDGDTAILVAPREPRAIADIAYLLLSDPEKRKSMGTAGRAWAAGNFRVETMVKKLERLYVGLLARAVIIVSCLFFLSVCGARAEEIVAETDFSTLSAGAFVRTDFIMQENNLDLDTKIRDDRTQYIALDYNFTLDLKGKNAGPEFFIKIERNGLYDYDVPIIIHNTLQTQIGKISPYHGAELLPYFREFWMETPVGDGFFRLKAGLYTYNVGHGIAMGGYYENYGIMVTAEDKNFKWNIYACAPDYENRKMLGPKVKQEKEQGIDWEHSKASFIATDISFPLADFLFQPYVGLLIDNTSASKRSDLFTTETRRDILGTVGISCDLNVGDFSAAFEIARNFGMADAINSDYDNVVHQGYAIWSEIDYEYGNFTPHGRFLYASGNKTTADMVTNGDETFPSSKNNAFSNYSPFNTYLADAIYPSYSDIPIIALGNGLGVNYGILRPGTFDDPCAPENLMLFCAGLDYSITEKASLTVDWWYLMSVEKGIGSYNNVPKVISPDLGNEVDVNINYDLTKNLNLNFLTCFFFPGAAYREERTDIDGSLLTPFVRGDGSADMAYQVEMSASVCF